MLQKVRIRGFKTIVDVTLELGQLNVFVGLNGAGMTNLFEGIALLGAAAHGQVTPATLEARSVRGTLTPCRSLLAAKKARKPEVTVAAWSEGAHYEASLVEAGDRGWPWTFASERLMEGDQELVSRGARHARLRLNRSNGKVITIKPEADRGLVPAVRGLHGGGPLCTLLDALEHFAIYSPHGCYPESVRGVLFDCAPELQRKPQLWRRIVKEVSRLTEWVEDMSDQGIVFSDRHLRRDAHWISAGAADDGTRLVLYTLMLLLLPDAPPVLALENADNALNPLLARRLMERVQDILLNERGRPQVLLVTQRPEVLDALALRDDRVRLFIVRRDKAGSTAVHRVEYSSALATEAGKNGMTLSQLWSSGTLGGMLNP